jgi:hypothetical protein
VDSQRNIAVVLDSEDLNKSIKNNISQEVGSVNKKLVNISITLRILPNFRKILM